MGVVAVERLDVLTRLRVLQQTLRLGPNALRRFQQPLVCGFEQGVVWHGAPEHVGEAGSQLVVAQRHAPFIRLGGLFRPSDEERRLKHRFEHHVDAFLERAVGRDLRALRVKACVTLHLLLGERTPEGALAELNDELVGARRIRAAVTRQYACPERGIRHHLGRERFGGGAIAIPGSLIHGGIRMRRQERRRATGNPQQIARGLVVLGVRQTLQPRGLRHPRLATHQGNGTRRRLHGSLSHDRA